MGLKLKTYYSFTSKTGYSLNEDSLQEVILALSQRENDHINMIAEAQDMIEYYKEHLRNAIDRKLTLFKNKDVLAQEIAELKRGVV